MPMPTASRRSLRDPAEYAAVVNGIPILMTDYVGEITTLYNVAYSQATTAQKRKVLDEMIRAEVYVQRGVELGLPTDDIDVRTALVAGTEAVVAQDALTELPSEAIGALVLARLYIRHGPGDAVLPRPPIK